MRSRNWPTFIVLTCAFAAIIGCGDDSPTQSNECDTYLCLDFNSLGTARSDWRLASTPVHADTGTQRGKILWHNRRVHVSMSDVYNRESKKGEGTIRPFRLIFRPDTSGSSWAGVTRYVGLDYTESNLHHLEMRIRGEHGLMHIDLGQISEDVDGDGQLDIESTNSFGFVSETDDVGLDGLPDSLEPGYDRFSNSDPNKDNWYFLGNGKCPLPENQCAELAANQEAARTGDYRLDSLYYEWLNGTEGNRDDPTSGGRADQEPLSDAGFNEINSYFSYLIDLAGTKHQLDSSENEFGWKTLRIPLGNSQYVDTIVDGSSVSWNSITHVRVWFEGGVGSNSDTLEVASWGIYYSPIDSQYTDSP